MKSILEQKKGQVSMGSIGGIVIGALGLVLTIFAILYAVSVLNPAGFFTAGTLEANETTNMVKNLTTAPGQFVSKLPTAFSILAIVFILGFLGLLVASVWAFMKNRQQGGY